MCIYSFRLKALTAAATALSFAAISTPATAQPLQPTSSWNVDYAENECRLVRDFGQDGNKIWLSLSAGASFTHYSLVIASPSFPATNRFTDIEIKATPLGDTKTVNAMPYSIELNGKKNQVFRSGIERAFFSNVNKDQVIEFKVKSAKTFELNANGLQKALEALNSCHDDLLTNKFKIDVTALHALQSLPLPGDGVASWVTTDDFPPAAIRGRWEGQTQFVMTVGTDGKAKDCRTITSSGHAILDQRACDLMIQRGRFTPAKGANGEPVAAPWISRVHWQIPR